MSRRRHLLAYDIADQGRLRKVHDIVLGYGHMVQYSVYVCDLDPVELIRLQDELRPAMNDAEDRILFLDLGEPEAALQAVSYLGQKPYIPSRRPQII